MPRLSGQVIPQAAPRAPLNYRLSEEVYALDGNGFIVQPGARLKVGPGGRLYETLGQSELEPITQAQLDVIYDERREFGYEPTLTLPEKAMQTVETVKRDVRRMSGTTLIVLGVAAYLLLK